MNCLVLRLAGPMQSWGVSSRFVRRTTESQPTKSGVLGLLAAAAGRRRTDPIEDLLAVSFGVRVDQPGRLVRDFQTARTMDGAHSMPLSYRFYLADAAFLAVVEGEPGFIDELDDALRHPVYPLYLGRRSCPPAGPVTLGIRRDASVNEVLSDEPWRAAPWWQKTYRSSTVALETVADAQPGAEDWLTVADLPISFDPERRLYALRAIERGIVTVTNPTFAGFTSHDDPHQPMAALGGA
ncbi:type I-E CRISPR-associated protein Cas5/CasD [Demequina lutea]|uniref:CRISPR system Cascade subunit CasD n=1 Tax=Demequina lutea TaxID=431489 RepID=A0A7Y9ZEQ9_9MICO|nr:type I-E CRISPR-associated protein Cas5/CasD [Demequina lutea]NYI42041.1 CRISPR system Cascade subunit CasD [Demequina lutea]